MRILIAEDEHIPEIIEIWTEFMDYNANIDAYDTRSEDGQTYMERYLEDTINSDDILLLVALEDNHTVAYSICTINNRLPVFRNKVYGFITDLAIRESYQRKGIGEQMLNKMIEWCKLKGVDRIETSVVAKNTQGHSFWKKQGFLEYERVLYRGL